MFLEPSKLLTGSNSFREDLAKSARSSPVEAKETKEEPRDELPLIVPPEPYSTKRGAAVPTRLVKY